MMENGFDKSALTYDKTFTHRNIGKYLRGRVHGYLDQNLPAGNKLSILELNCGTGEDAIYFARHGHCITATDSSIQMLKIAKRKAAGISLKLDLKFGLLNIKELGQSMFKGTYDLVFSDFGGLNCISPESLKELSVNLKKVLAQNGKFIAVVMSKYCIWEIGYYFLKGKINKSFRRSASRALDVSMNGNVIRTYYYTPSELKKIFTPEFIMVNKSPIGLFLPPTYMESFFNKRPVLLSFFNKLESKFGKYNWSAVFGDHFLIEMKVK